MSHYLATGPDLPAAENSPRSNENEQEDFDIVQYARFYRLCEDPTKVDALRSIDISLPSFDIFRDLDDLTCGTSVKFLEELGSKERINIDRNAAAHLKWVSSLQDPSLANGSLQLERDGMICHKAEVPLLRTDHELDMRAFRSSQSHDVLSTHNIPLEELVDEADQSFAWPSNYDSFPGQQDEQLKGEKISVTRDVFLHLQANIKDAFTDEDEQSVIATELPGHRLKALLEPLTPPLLSLSPPQEPCIPSSPVVNFELLSESTGTTAAEAQALEEKLFKGDRIVPQRMSADSGPMLLDDYDIGQVYSPLHPIVDPSSSPPMKRIRREDLKIEGPMTPPMNFESPGKLAKTVSFKESLEEYIPELPSTYIRKDDTSLTSEAEFEKYFDEMIRPFAEEAERRTQQEQLKQDGNVQRIGVPILDFAMQEPPWMEFARKPTRRPGEDETDLDSHKKLLSMMKHENFRNERPWSGTSKLERQLTWTPFPAQIAKIADDDKINDDGTLAKIMDELTVGENIDSASLTWKPEGLRILDDSEDEDDDLEGNYPENQQDMSSLLRKRRREMDDEVQSRKRISSALITCREVQGPSAEHAKKSRLQAVPEKINEDRRTHDSEMMFGGMFSATSALHNYMSLHGVSAKTSAANKDRAIQPVAPQKPTAPVSSKASEAVKQIATLEKHSPRSNPLTVPNLWVPTTPTPFIINSQVLAQRYLFRRLEQLFPSANFIERDFTPRVSHPHPGDEADIILSPSTGLIWTTLQKIRQRPLPGQVARNTVKDRIQAIAGRYERLIVLVSEGAVAPAAPFSKRPGLGVAFLQGYNAEKAGMTANMPDERDSLAFADLVAFAAGLEDEVIVSYIPGGEETLAHWIVSILAKYGTARKLLEEETLWERFLRCAGMNAYAAQAVFPELKAPDDDEGVMVDDRADGMHGLPAFVRMGREERMKRFEMLLGGRKVLERVGRVLDSRWVSAAGGKWR